MRKTIYEKIEIKASKDAEEIIRAGQEKAKQIEERIISEAKDTIEKNLNKVRKRGEEFIKTKTTELEQKAKQKTLALKKELIKAVVSEAAERLNSLSDERLVELVKKLVLSENLKGDETILVNSRDYERYLRLFSENRKDEDGLVILEKLNRELGKEKFRLRLAKESANISGGFIVVGKTFDVDLSFETILNSLQEKHETEIAQILFARGE
ncbi:MAG TPA: V-type ATP synthase subunit E [Bacilli bacterium]